MGPRVRCKSCNDVIQSKSRHDLVSCKCGAIFVDGGDAYLRLGFPANKDPEDCYEVLGDVPGTGVTIRQPQPVEPELKGEPVPWLERPHKHCMVCHPELCSDGTCPDAQGVRH